MKAHLARPGTHARVPRRLGGWTLTMALALGGLGAQAADPSQFSEAEKLVFTQNQMANLKGPASVRYSFVKSGSLEPGFEDSVRIEIDRAKAVRGEFLSGPRAFNLPPVEDAEANPVILFFLERDIKEMERLTKGKANYFRKRIRMAMVDEALVRDTRVSYKGTEVAAREVTLSPYAKDPMRQRYDRYADKRYVFVLSDAVPGGVYQLRTALPGATANDAPVLEEVLTLTDTPPKPATPAPARKATPTP